MYENISLGDSGDAWVDEAAGHRLAAVFVHGWGGDCEQTWTWRPPRLQRWSSRAARRQSVLLFDLLKEEGLPWDFYSVRHAAGPVSQTDIDQVAGLVRTVIESYARGKAVALIAHSLGGLACRQAALDLLDRPDVEFPIAGLLLYGTPNSGTQLARYGDYVSSISASEMEPLSNALTRTNQRWTTQVINGGDPRHDPRRRAHVLCWNAIGQKDRVVPKNSSAGLSFMGDVKTLPGDHTALAKVRDTKDLGYTVLKDFLAAAAAAVAERPIHRAAGQLAEERRHSTLTAGWTLEEEEYITLRDEGEPRHLQCEIRQLRRGGSGRRTLKLCLRLADLQAPALDFAFEYSIGQGVLDDGEFGQFAKGLASAVLVTQYLSVAQLSVEQGGRRFDYADDGAPQRGPGWVVLSFSCAGDLREKETYELLELKVRTLVPRGIGWYTYRSPRTVLDRLVVGLEAPFPLVCRPRLGKGTGAPKNVGDYSEVSASGPVPCGSTVDWMFVEKKVSETTNPQKERT